MLARDVSSLSGPLRLVDRVESEIRDSGNDRRRIGKLESNVGPTEVLALPIFKTHNQTENYR